VATPSVTRRGLRQVASFIRLHPGPFSLSVVGAAGFAACTVLATVVLGRVTDDVVVPTFETGRPPTGTVVGALAAVLAVAVLRVAGVLTRRYFAGVTTERTRRTLRQRLTDRYLDVPLEFHQRTPTGQLLAHADTDTERGAEFLNPLPFSLGVGFLALFSVVNLLRTDVVLAGIALAVFPALAVLNKVYSLRVEGPATRTQAAAGRVSAIAHESFDGALVVKALGRERDEVARFSVVADELRRHRVEIGNLRALFEPALDALPNLGIVAVVLVGTARIEAGALTPGELVQVAALFSVLAFPMRVFGFFLESLPHSVVALERIDSVLGEPAAPRPDRPSALPGGPLGLDVRELSFGYEALQPVLSRVSFRVEPGEVVALVGSTGAGKTTLCHLLAGLVRPDHGSILVGGVAAERIDPEDLSAALAMVFQESFLFADTLRANIDVAGTASDQEVRAAMAIARATAFVDALPAGLDTVVGERGVTLSGGQRQRIALARALLRRPRLLVLDDATSAVDPRIEQQILDGLRRELDMTTLIVAQRVSTITLADRVLYLADGRIAASGRHLDLLAQPGYEALVRAYDSVAP
jgi:ABC-type multidrug transport system fused ATPase/permease subunit